MGIHPYPHALWITLCMLARDRPRGPSPSGGPAHGQKSAISRIAYEIKWLPVERRVNEWAEAVEQPVKPTTARLCTTDGGGLARPRLAEPTPLEERADPATRSASAQT